MSRVLVYSTSPAHYDTIRQTPLVIVLHGHGESAENFENFEKYTGMSLKADTEGFIAVYPQALGDPSDCHTAVDGPSNRDDIALVRSIIDVLERRYRIDRRRIYAAGHSNGGTMTYRLASTLSDGIAAIGVTAGSIGMIDEQGDTLRFAPPSHPVSVIHFHGLDDADVPYLGGPESDGPDDVVSVRNAISFWMNADRCAAIVSSRSVSRGSQRHNRPPLALCARHRRHSLHHRHTIVDGTHRWPGDDVPWYTFSGRDDSDIVATDAMWAFFAAHPRVN